MNGALIGFKIDFTNCFRSFRFLSSKEIKHRITSEKPEFMNKLWKHSLDIIRIIPDIGTCGRKSLGSAISAVVLLRNDIT